DAVGPFLMKNEKQGTQKCPLFERVIKGCHCEEPPGDVAIPWYKDHPENRRDCHAAFAARNDVITGRAIHESPLQNTQKNPPFPEKRGIAFGTEVR
ncbi:MAG: hypothetical protein IKU31_08730, partial [Oscillospiraceae bacterium]|nr:hypothetical protein [Oscillospiraceae bacterium]